MPPGLEPSFFRLQTPLTYFLVFLLLASVQANPLKNPSICGRPTCQAEGNKFNYSTDYSYDYLYSVDVHSLFGGTSENSSRLHVETSILLEFRTPCDGEISISDVFLTEKGPTYDREEDTTTRDPELPNASDFANALTNHKMRFAFNDGLISEICPHADDPTWVLNFKRGILSTLQNTMLRFDVDYTGYDVDVNGECETKYQLIGPLDTSLLIKRTKNMATCSSRYKHHSILQTTPYKYRSDYQASPLMRSTSECEFIVDHRIYSKIDCKEKHIFDPFSNGENGAQTKIRQTLTLKGEYRKEVQPRETETTTKSPEEKIEKRNSILFDHDLTPKPLSGELKTARELIKDMCKYNSDDVAIEFPDVFTKFIHIARHLSHAALSQMYARAETICPTGRRHILDALPYLRSNAAINLMKDLVNEKQVPNDIFLDWISSLAFMPRPDVTTMNILQVLLKQVDTSEVELTVSSIVHTFCKFTSNCQTQPAVQEIVSFFENKIKEGCMDKEFAKERKVEEKIIIGLKSIGNMGIFTDSVAETLKLCIQQEDLPLSIRIGAIEAHRRSTCLENRDFFLKIFQNHTEDSEIRIASYLEVMRCPDYNVVMIVKSILENEEVNQVGSFVWSHLTNVMKSSVPSRIEIQGILHDKDLLKKFSDDFRKFSRNFEGSIYFGEYNTGGNYDANLIFSPNSYIPRSAMINLTIDLFGESINIFEITSRMEGFEHYLESMFGSKGPFSEKIVKQKLENYGLRLPRSIADNEIMKIENLPYNFAKNYNQPKFSLAMKIFGNDLKYNSFVGYQEIVEALMSINPVAKLKKLLSGKEVAFNKESLFLDTSYVMPTQSGFPISLSAHGTAAVNLKMSGFISTKNIFDKGEFDIEGKLRPSVAIDVVGTMSLDAYHAATGIKLKTNLFSSAAIEGKAKMRGKQLLNVTFSLPNDKTEIIRAESELIVMRGEVEEFQEGVTKNRIEKSMCSWDVLDKTLGLKLCADFHFPNNSRLPESSSTILNGPTKFLISLNKADPTAKIYWLEYKWVSNDNTTLISVLFDTPGSAVKRELSGKLKLDMNSQNLTILLKSPESQFLAHGKYKNTDDEKYVVFGLDINGKKHLDAQFGWKRKNTPHGATYLPKIYLGINNERIAELVGTLKYVSKKGIGQYEVDLRFETKKLITTLVGYVRKSNVSISFNVKCDYQFEGSKNEYVRIEAKLARVNSHSITQAHGNFELDCSAYPNFNFVTSLKFQHTDGHIDMKLDVNTSPELKDDTYILTLHGVTQYSSTYRKNQEERKMKAFLAITKPNKDIDMKFQIVYALKGPEFSNNILIRYAKEKEIIIDLNIKNSPSQLLSFEARLEIKVPSFIPAHLKLKIHEKNPNDYNFQIDGTWFSGHDFNIIGHLERKLSLKYSNNNFKLYIKSNNFKEIGINGAIYKDDMNFKFEIHADQNNNNYFLNISHISLSHSDFQSFFEIRYPNKVYSVSSLAHLSDRREVQLEIHLDQYRDVHIILRGLNLKRQKDAKIEVKWDANRDPGQRFAAGIELLHPERLNYSGNAIVTFPGRTLKGDYLFAIKGARYVTSGHFEWSPIDLIDIQLDAIYKYHPNINLYLKSQLITPFENWKLTSLTSSFHQKNNMLHLNGSVNWQDDQNVALDIFGDYEYVDSSNMRYEFNASVLSNIPQVSSMAGSFSHKQKSKHYESNVLMEYNKTERIEVRSIWDILENEQWTNLTGKMHLASPFNGYRRGMLITRMQLTKSLDIIKGVADFELDKKDYTMSLEGNLKQLTESMIMLNITTPVAKYKTISGRFGFSESKKHLVADLRWIKGGVGIEILLSVISRGNFDVRFHLATPIEYLNRILLIAKLKPDSVDFRCGWNIIVVGFSGTKHYTSKTDFDYTYKVYTPLKGLEENGVVAKFIFLEGLDAEFSLHLADIKLGGRIEAAPKPQVITSVEESEVIEEEDDDFEEEVEIHWGGMLELDLFIYPTVKGAADFDQRDTLYILQASLQLANGTTELHNEFNLIDFFTVTNRFEFTTPFPAVEELTSDFNFLFSPGEYFGLSIENGFKNRGDWFKGGIITNYTYEKRSEDDVRSYRASLKVYTPFKSFKKLDVLSMLDVDDGTYRSNITVITDKSNVNSALQIEIEEAYIEASLVLVMISPNYSIPQFKVTVKRDFTESEKLIEIHVDRFDRMRGVKGILKWEYIQNKRIMLALLLQSPIPVLTHIEAGIKLLHPNTNELHGEFDFAYSPNRAIRLTGQFKDSDIRLILDTPIKNYEHMIFTGISQGSPKNQILSGSIEVESITKRSSKVIGKIIRSEEFPLIIEANLVNPSEDVGKVHFMLKSHLIKDGMEIQSTVELGKQRFILEAISHYNKTELDLSLKVDTSHLVYRSVDLNGKILMQPNGNITATLNADTTIPGAEKVRLGGNYWVGPNVGEINAIYDFPGAEGDWHADWSSSWFEDMSLSTSGSFYGINVTKQAAANFYYRNPKKNYQKFESGFDVDLHRGAWTFGLDSFIAFLSTTDASYKFKIKLPQPHHEIHVLKGGLKFKEDLSFVDQSLYYETELSDLKFGTSTKFANSAGIINGNTKFEWTSNLYTNNQKQNAIDNIIKLKQGEKETKIQYFLETPFYEAETFSAHLIHLEDKEWHNIRVGLFKPNKAMLALAHVNFKNFANMDGILNTTTPFQNINYTGATFKSVSIGRDNERFVELFWPNNTALFTSNFTYEEDLENLKIKGKSSIEIPLASRHIGIITFDYDKIPLHAIGNASINYNGKSFLFGKYIYDWMEAAGLDEDTVLVELENDILPVGFHYFHTLQYDIDEDGNNFPNTDFKHLEVFKLHDNGFNVTGELNVESSLTGQNITIRAIHVNRTVTLQTNYDSPDHEFKQSSFLQLDQHSWATYEIKIFNSSIDGTDEERAEIEIAYPGRNFSINGHYKVSDDALSSSFEFEWDKQMHSREKRIGSSIDWTRISKWPNKQKTLITITHPSFLRNITLDSYYTRDHLHYLDFNSQLEYSIDPSKKFAISGIIQDKSRDDQRLYNIEFVANHPSTKLDLKIDNELKLSNRLYYVINKGIYKRSYLPVQIGTANARLDLNNKEVEIDTNNIKETYYLKGKFINNYPYYLINGTVVHGKELNSTGYLYIHLNEQILSANVNMTADASESFHMHGTIPDSRHVYFDAWRQYEDIHLSDIAFYLALNHSRLITSKLNWRPDLANDIMSGVRYTFTTVTESFNDGVEFWKQYIRSESTDAFNDIWFDAKPIMQDFLDDMNELKTLEKDFTKFKSFLNASYEANEFYIKDLVNVTNFFINELSIRRHIESFPEIINEIWDVMGESGKAIQKSLLWMIETIKTTYKKVVEFIASVLRGESINEISALFDALVDRYDKFLKDLHISFIKHVQQLYNKAYEMVVNNVKYYLETIEPTFIKCIHYLETIVWNIAKEILDFLYERKNEIIDSPYFIHVGNVTRDLDKFYKDIMKNDLVTNVKKYSKLFWEIAKERYFAYVPFAKELENIVLEIIHEIKQIGNLPTIKYALDKMNELKEKIEYLYEYFDMGTKLQNFIVSLHKKIMELRQTALQAENRYRRAKTKFIFDPVNGNIELEQKLPMSYHAFNETPRFEEIPEYKLITDVQSYFATSNTTFWTLYYKYKPYTEPSNWLPPFRKYALIAGPQNLMTFDKKFYEYAGKCSYLLANDFVDHNFSLVITYNSLATKRFHEISLIVDRHHIVIDLFNNNLEIDSDPYKTLPYQINDTYIYQEEEILYITSERGFFLTCNMKFDVCLFELSGWYYGKTAGLLGSIDNEPSNDFKTPSGEIVELDEFAHSWSLGSCSPEDSKNFAHKTVHPSNELISKCESMFLSPASHFSPCFTAIDPSPFYKMCLDSESTEFDVVCTASVAYIKICSEDNTPLRIPDECIKCQSNLINGTELIEGDFVKLEKDEKSHSSDVVFLIEAKECNRDIRRRKFIDNLLGQINDQLIKNKITNNRYALVTFGGSGIFDEPRSIIVNKNIFTSNAAEFGQYFDNYDTGFGNADIFGAIRFATKLNFRPGVSKTFLLIPCTNCDSANMTVDYEVLQQVLIERDITLHILFNDEFKLDKQRFSKLIYGIDAKTAFTKKDVKVLRGGGNHEIFKQIKRPKSMLGLCMPLALETNGTVFTSKRIEPTKPGFERKFFTVFTKRIAETAQPENCHSCECTADEHGNSYMECLPCEYPTSPDVTLDGDEDISDESILSDLIAME